ncbi:hypothetical protein M8371_32430, partial [Klebsiella pneumoniae]|nr:hypothetical protein [Klebsiella pneumoniae]
GVESAGNLRRFERQPTTRALNLNGRRSPWQGTVNTRQGQIALSGNADWTQIDNWRAQIAAKGSRVRITVPPLVLPGGSPEWGFAAPPRPFHS